MRHAHLWTLLASALASLEVEDHQAEPTWPAGVERGIGLIRRHLASEHQQEEPVLAYSAHARDKAPLNASRATAASRQVCGANGNQDGEAIGTPAKVGDACDCEATCHTTPGCVAWTFYDDDAHVIVPSGENCWLRKVVSHLRLDCGPKCRSGPAQQAEQHGDSLSLEGNERFAVAVRADGKLLEMASKPEVCGDNGNQDGKAMGSPSKVGDSCACETLCRGTPGCAAWTYYDDEQHVVVPSGDNCWLREAASSMALDCGPRCRSGIVTEDEMMQNTSADSVSYTLTHADEVEADSYRKGLHQHRFNASHHFARLSTTAEEPLTGVNLSVTASNGSRSDNTTNMSADITPAQGKSGLLLVHQPPCIASQQSATVGLAVASCLEGNTIAFGGTCTVSCQHGYFPALERTTCAASGMFAHDLRCSGNACNMPAVEGAEWSRACTNYSNIVAPQIASDSTCKGLCREGYTPSHSMLSCANGVLSPSNFSCKPQACTSLIGIDNAPEVTCAEGGRILPGERCTPRCNEGFWPSVQALQCLKGSLSPANYTCDAEWSLAGVGTCEHFETFRVASPALVVNDCRKSCDQQEGCTHFCYNGGMDVHDRCYLFQGCWKVVAQTAAFPTMSNYKCYHRASQLPCSAPYPLGHAKATRGFHFRCGGKAGKADGVRVEPEELVAFGAECQPECSQEGHSAVLYVDGHAVSATSWLKPLRLTCGANRTLLPAGGELRCEASDCMAPLNISNAMAGDICREGHRLPSGGQCTPRCAVGFSAVPAALQCQNGKLSPPSFACQAAPCPTNEACEEEGAIPSGGSCTPKCLHGGIPTEGKLVCNNGNWTPSTFQCLNASWIAETGWCEEKCAKRDAACRSSCSRKWVPSVVRVQREDCNSKADLDFWRDSDTERRAEAKQACWRALLHRSPALKAGRNSTTSGWRLDFLSCTDAEVGSCRTLAETAFASMGFVATKAAACKTNCLRHIPSEVRLLAESYQAECPKSLSSQHSIKERRRHLLGCIGVAWQQVADDMQAPARKHAKLESNATGNTSEFSLSTTMVAPWMMHLSSQNLGCHMLHTEADCIAATDGRLNRTFTGSPCHWCCGASCTSPHTSKCEPREWLLRQPSFSGRSKNGLGHDTCKVERRNAPLQASGPEGCSSFRSEEACLAGRDANLAANSSGAACAWCCGRSCLTNGSSMCEAQAWLDGHPTFDGESKNAFGNNTCKDHLALISGRSCHEITSVEECLNSRDGGHSIGSPCEWCCGGQCLPDGTSNSTCEARSWLISQNGFTGRSMNGLGDNSCEFPRNGFISLAMHTAKDGCGTIDSQAQCLASKDPSDGMPCEWCCGEPCFGVNSSKCSSGSRLLVLADSYHGKSRNGVGADTCEVRPKLKAVTGGKSCHDIVDEAQCMASKDGVSDSPCEWCCGAACVAHLPHKCGSWHWLSKQATFLGRSRNGLGRNTCEVYLPVADAHPLDASAR